ncbi:MAG TPA: aminobenzoyl-glutamate transporter [Planctomycetaceae bacterium]|nr:aminobenzoyl-glutamate transporter [Planctomycetaceae bacterium]
MPPSDEVIDSTNGPNASDDSVKNRRTPVEWLLDRIERIGNALPDPAVLFVIALILVWVASAWLSGISFTEINPATKESVKVVNLLTGPSIAAFLENMVKSFTAFPPLGVVLVAMLGVGVAEASGLVHVGLKELLRFTPKQLLTPMLLLVAVISHTAADAGYLLVIPIGGVMFHAAGRHPLAGIACAFAGVSGGFSANFLPSGIDPLLAGLTESGVLVVDADRKVNALCNLYFTAASSILVILVGWYLTDRIVEPRLRITPFTDEEPANDSVGDVTTRERIGLIAAIAVALVGAVAMILWCWPADSPMRADGSLTSVKPPAPLMGAIVPLIFFFFFIPGIVHGYVSGRFKNHRDVIAGMKKAMESMGYYLVLVFFAALFINAFTSSNLGLLLALKGAALLESMRASGSMTIIGLVFITAFVNLFIGSASAKWALLAPIFVPMLMLRGVSPELTQAAYRVGDSSTNIITPMMPYFPLVVVFCQRYVKQAGVGTLGSLMLPYSLTFLLLWTIFLLGYWTLGLPLGIDAPYTYTSPGDAIISK